MTKFPIFSAISSTLVSIFSAPHGRSMNGLVEARWKIVPSHYFILRTMF